MPCDYRILQSPTNEQAKLILLEGRRAVSYSIPQTQDFLIKKCAPPTIWVVRIYDLDLL